MRNKFPQNELAELTELTEAPAPPWLRFARGTDEVYLGSALDVLPTLPDESVDLVFADPPYNIGKRFGDFADRWPSDEAYAAWCRGWLEQCIAKLKPHGSLYVMTSTQAMPYLDLFLRGRMTVQARIVWHYDSSGVQARRHYGSAYEPILFCVKDKRRYTFNGADIRVEAPTGARRKLVDYRKNPPATYGTQKIPGNVWYFPRVRYRMAEYEQHPAQKPEALLERIVRAGSNPGDVVLDPFAGAFTTAAVARRLGRGTISIESQREYLKIGLRRLEIQTELDGEALQPPPKNFTRKNGVGSRAH